jgi:hypothetical protein
MCSRRDGRRCTTQEESFDRTPERIRPDKDTVSVPPLRFVDQNFLRIAAMNMKVGSEAARS